MYIALVVSNTKFKVSDTITFFSCEILSHIVGRNNGGLLVKSKRFNFLKVRKLVTY